MREIKFRAWDGEEMCDFFHCWLEPEKLFRGIRLDAAYRTSLAQCTPKAIMQYTGIKDRNGVEIYEGDILETPYEYHGNIYTSAEDESGLYRGRVHYTPSKGFIQRDVIVKDDESDKWERRGPLEIRSSYASVIGNIYENPDLVGHAIK